MFAATSYTSTNGNRRKYCVSCGSLAPYDAVYCPHCGAIQEAKVTGDRAPHSGDRGPRIVSRSLDRTRLYLFLVSLAMLLASFLLGSVAPLSRHDAEAIVQEFQQAVGSALTVADIFMNNLELCIRFFIPVCGTYFMALVTYDTGVVLAAVAMVSPSSPSVLAMAFVTLLSPWSWLEFAAYSLASSSGLMIIISVVRHNLRKEVGRFLLALLVSVVLLALGAVIEVLAINAAMAG